MKKYLFALFLVFSISLNAQTHSHSHGQSQEQSDTTESFEELIKPYLKKILDGIEMGAEFVIEQTPLVIQEYIMFEAVKCGLIVALGLFFLFGSKVIRRRLFAVTSESMPTSKRDKIYYKKVGKNSWLRMCRGEEETGESFGFYAFKWVFNIVGIILLLVNTLPFVKVAFFPKLFLLEKFIHLVT